MKKFGLIAVIGPPLLLLLAIGALNSRSLDFSGILSDLKTARHRGIGFLQVRSLHAQRGLTTYEIDTMPQNKLERALRRAASPMPDHPGEAVAFRRLQMQDENGFIPADGLYRAQQQRRRMLLAALPDGRSKSQSLAPEEALASWTWLGPGNIGGRVRAIVIHPVTTGTMWAGSVSGGLWKTTNGGTSWSVVDDFMANLAISTLVMDPTNSNTLYAGTGEGFYNSDGIRGAGVFKSTDGGTTWAQLPETAGSDWYYVNRLAIPWNSTAILAATRSGIFRSTDGGTSWSMTSGATNITDIDYNPTDSNKAVAGGFNGQALYSTNGGQAWNTVAAANRWATDAPLGRVELAYAPSNATIVYASVNQNNGEVWKSTNGGQSFTQLNTGNSYLGSQGWYNNVIWVSPVNSSFLIIGGIDIWRSTDGGSSLTKISQWYSAPLSAHADNHAIVPLPGFNGTTSKTVFIGNDGGIYKAADITTVAATSGWTELNNQLGITQFYGAAGNATTGVIIGGTQDNGTLLYTPASGSEGWTTPFGGDGGFSAADPTNSNYFYGEYTYLNLHRSSNAGTSSDYISGYYWNGSSWAWKAAPYVIGDAQTSSANFIAPFILDPNNPQRILAGGLSLWRSSDARTANTNTTGPAWSAIKSSTGTNISAIAIAPGNSDQVWVGHNNGSVFKTTNGTTASPSWTQVDNNPTSLPDRYVGRIAVVPGNTNKVYVTFGGFNSNNVWVTTNGGSNWAAAYGSGATALPAAPVRSLAIHPQNTNYLYAGTEVGVFNSTDGGATWTVPHMGPSNVSVDELFWMNRQLVAATHGRGLFSAGMDLSPGNFSKSGPAAGATGISASPTLSWGASSGATSYDYCYDTTNDNACSAWISTPSTSPSLSGLSANTTYYWQARANNAGVTVYADGSATSFRSFTTGSAPGAFFKSNPTAGATGMSPNPSLSWTAGSGAGSYEYCYDTTNDNACSSWTSSGSQTSVVLSGMAPGTTYYWQVRAINSLGFSATYADGTAAAFRSFTTGVLPGSFGKSSPAANAANQAASLSLTWSPSAHTSIYEYCYDTSNDNACATWISGGTSTAAALGSLISGSTYYWQVRAVNSLGGWTAYADGSADAFRSFTTGIPPGSFQKSSPAASATGMPSNPSLGWSDSTGASGFEYCIDTTNDSSCSPWISTGTATHAELSLLTPSTAYYWQVRAVSTLGFGPTYADGAAASYGSFTTGGAPGDFGKSSPVHAALATDTGLILRWGSSTEAASYEFCFDTTDDGACSNWTDNGSSTSATLTGLTIGVPYFWQVRARNSLGFGSTFADASATAYWSFTVARRLFLPSVLSNR